MILSSMENLKFHNLDRFFEKNFLKHILKNNEHNAGSRQILEQGMFCFDSESITLQESDSSMLFENHRKYIDIHLIIQGSERFIIDDADVLIRATAYDKDKDKEFFTSNGNQRYKMLLSAGDFIVLYPGEAHLCCLAEKKPVVLKKRIYKIPIDNQLFCE